MESLKVIMKSFGLRNQRGSCWVNATLQSIFRIPDVQVRFHDEAYDKTNPVEVALHKIWSSGGEDGLKDFYACVNTTLMPAGEGIGDSHELLEFLCDKVPFLDKMFRFKVANQVSCKNCRWSELKRDSMIEYPIVPSGPKQTLVNAIHEATTPLVIDDWKCEACKNSGCSKQFLMGTFPQILTFHVTSLKSTVTYSSVLTLNGKNYALFAVICFDGGHWWTYGRDLPPGKPWVFYNDANVQTHSPNQFPLSDNMRLLMYYRLP